MNPDTLTIFDWREARDRAMKQVSDNAGLDFRRSASAFILGHLAEHGESSSEAVTDAMWNAGITAHDRRATGPVFMALMRAGQIEKCGTCIRKRGHGTSGGNLWRLKA